MKRSIPVFFFLFLFRSVLLGQTLQTVTNNGNSTTTPVIFSGHADFGDAYDPVVYGALQIARPANQGNTFHLSFIRNGSMVYGMGFLNNSDIFGIQPGGSNENQNGFFLSTSGNVGIGTNNPDQKLTVRGGIGFDYISSDKKLYAPADGVLEWMTHNSAGEHAFAVSHQGNKVIYLNTSGSSYFNGGNVGIGTTTPTEMLSVNGRIRSREVKVENLNWPDYVFAKDYEMPSLSDTEKQIKDLGHLPGIPSASEVKANGIDLGEMNAKLLQKVEELTLYLIEMKKENEIQNQKFSEQIRMLKSRIK